MRRSHDKRWNRIWFFFLIVAVGLILSWAQVGKKYQQMQQQEAREYLLLRNEENCDLFVSPCAAYAPEYALVAHMQHEKGWKSLSVRAVGKPFTEQTRIKFTFVPTSSLYTEEILPVRFQSPDIWYTDVQLPDLSSTGWKFRVSVDMEDFVYVADFRLKDRQKADQVSESGGESLNE